ncbi:uncharacterized protein LOC128236815 [Mya arenaria]|uniref:uncharacterized protein LOC128236815 n=1 Tax=Mya arenaria TaxID=6604 RepID=UPI0022E65144|nr:uncharacterized protein LOC128236815 [Mya arenaria]XP_052807885.1 uncharacterized protein LOC128236815 [Mya arenaria]XP_052807887.1 uncharacterized protein LOC128236815 [Mya arenaria]
MYEKTLEYSREECERREKFYCEQYGRCISRLLMCNRNDDCPGKEDETWALCYEEKETCERKGKFRCNITDTCVSLSYLCNGLKQCPIFITAQNLCESRGHFFCSSSQMCLSIDKVCDHVADCAEEEDESAKSCRTPTPTPTTTKLSENLVPDLKGDKNNNNVVLIVLSTVLPVLFVTILVLGSYFYIKKARSLCPMMRPATVSQSERTAMFTRRAASSIRRTRSEVIYMDIDEDVGGMYPCHREEKHEYDKVNDRPPCACLKCVRERVTPMLRSHSVRTRIEPLPTGSLYRRTLKVENNIPTVGINKNGEDKTIPLYLDLDAGNDKLKDFDVNRTESENGKEKDEEVVNVTSQIARSENKDGSDVKNTSNDYLHPIASTNSNTLTRPKTNLSGERKQPRPKTIHI